MVFGFLALFVCATASAANFDWRVSKGFPVPSVPADNPMSSEKVELGRHLFYDVRLSVNGRQSCASCHQQKLAFTDGLARAKGTTGEIHPRSSMSLVNVGYAPVLTWANPDLFSLEEQALEPMMGTSPVELGLKGSEQKVLAQLNTEPIYMKLFPVAFPGELKPYTMANVTKALAAFERSIISTRSPYDRYRYAGDPGAISPAAKRGEILFFSSERAGCFQCHGGWSFSGGVRYEGGPPSHREQVRTPTLRNIAVTAPYMKDGSLATLEDVIDRYASGRRAADIPSQSAILHGFPLSPGERADLIEFLKSLTDGQLLTDPRWSNPW